MSKTDKTTPFKVILVRDGVVTHDHRAGRECDFDQFDPKRPWHTHCGYRLNMSWHRQERYFGRPRRAASIEDTLERQARHKVNRTLKDVGRDFDEIAFDDPLDSAYFIW